MGKTCFRCGVTKDISCFYKHPGMSDGHFGKCKECAKKDQSGYYSNNKAHYEEYDRNRRQNPSMRERINNSQKKYYRKNRDRLLATRRVRSKDRFNRIKLMCKAAIRRAVEDGKIRKPSLCSLCGRRGETVYGHHHDYTKPLDVIWVCSMCHGMQHRKKRK